MTLRRSTRPMKRTRLRARSERREAEMKVRRPMLATLAVERVRCDGYDRLTAAMRADMADGAFERAALYQRVLRACRQWAPGQGHEPLKRSRGGSITDTANTQWLCDPCHRFTEAEVTAATDAGMLIPSWER